MHSDERHELQQNDLQEFIGGFGEFWKKHGNTVMIIITLAVVAWAGWTFYHNSQLASHENAWSDLALTSSPESFREVAQKHEDSAVTALAYLRSGDGFLERATRVGDAPGAEGEADPLVTTREDDLAQAAQAYEAALAAADQDVFKINALLGLAVVAESRNDLAKAGDYYKQAHELASAEYPTLASIAGNAQDELARLAHPIPFGKEPETPKPAAPEAVITPDDVLPQAPAPAEPSGSATPTPAAPASAPESPAEPAPASE